MVHYRTSSHSRFDLKYHFVWVTKYRKCVLTGEVGLRLREIVREVCRTNDIEILQGSIGKEHVHVLLSCPPNLSPSKIMQYIKGKGSRRAVDGVQAFGTVVLGAALLGAWILRRIKWKRD